MIQGHSGYHSDRADLRGQTLYDAKTDRDIGTIERADRVGRDAASGLLDTVVIVRSATGVTYSYTLGERYRIRP